MLHGDNYVHHYFTLRWYSLFLVTVLHISLLKKKKKEYDFHHAYTALSSLPSCRQMFHEDEVTLHRDIVHWLAFSVTDLTTMLPQASMCCNMLGLDLWLTKYYRMTPMDLKTLQANQRGQQPFFCHVLFHQKKLPLDFLICIIKIPIYPSSY